MISHWLEPDELSDVDVLSADDCWSLMNTATVGRLGVRADGGVDIFPVNFLVTDRVVYLRSAPGAKLIDMAHASTVAFETDGSHRRTHWSVVIKGTAERLSLDADIEQSGILDLPTMTSSSKWNYVRITPFALSGRRFTVPKPLGARW